MTVVDFTPGTRRRGRRPNPLRPMALELEAHADYLERQAKAERAAAAALRGRPGRRPYPAIERLRDPGRQDSDGRRL